MAVLLETTMGDLVVELRDDIAPTAVENFVKLCKIKYYNNTLFHTIEKDYMVKCGDPSNSGRPGDSIFSKLGKKKYFNDEIRPDVKHAKMGTVAMANSKPNENGSAFYITLADNINYLDGRHTIFGTIAEGMDILKKINETIVDDQKKPFNNVRLLHTMVLDDPFDDPNGLDAIIPPRSPDVIADTHYKKLEDAADENEVLEKIAEAEAKSR